MSILNVLKHVLKKSNVGRQQKREFEENALEVHFSLFDPQLVRNDDAEPEYYSESKIVYHNAPVHPASLFNYIMLPRDFGRQPAPKIEKHDAYNELRSLLAPVAEQFGLPLVANPITDACPFYLGVMPDVTSRGVFYHGSSICCLFRVADGMRLKPCVSKRQCSWLELAGEWLHLTAKWQVASQHSQYTDLGACNRSKPNGWFVNMIAIVKKSDCGPSYGPDDGAKWLIRRADVEVSALCFEVRRESELKSMRRYISPHVGVFKVFLDRA